MSCDAISARIMAFVAEKTTLGTMLWLAKRLSHLFRTRLFAAFKINGQALQLFLANNCVTLSAPRNYLQ